MNELVTEVFVEQPLALLGFANYSLYHIPRCFSTVKKNLVLATNFFFFSMTLLSWSGQSSPFPPRTRCEGNFNQ